MKLKTCLVLFALLLTGAGFAQTKSKEDKIDSELQQCLDKKENQSTAGMVDCAYKALNKWNAKLNTTYKSLLAKLDSTAKNSLIEAQRQWIKFKEKEIDLIDATYGSAHGTMWRIVRAQKVMDITKQRAMELEDLLETLKQMQ
ncbi:lysozyme inhibitor LprI family protein [Danxiaibacter flavus]|uniref:Lysozyme inhibitor LprI family protein n=1 Tax=Danxiaibacter flavus TaxID=3049108 RepID=A0ABV3ZHU9_9BACT|nr:DUF1311 domain-containing protein [Chitinophagaceae bacterium DXS]